MTARTKQTPTLEQRLYEAWHKGRGVHLMSGEVVQLLSDDAIATRVTDVALQAAGREPEGVDGLPSVPTLDWSGFVARLKEGDPNA